MTGVPFILIYKTVPTCGYIGLYWQCGVGSLYQAKELAMIFNTSSY